MTTMAAHRSLPVPSRAAAEARAQARKDRMRAETVLEPESERALERVEQALQRNHFMETAQAILAGFP